jgi:predicted HicB family RNase H-like nuclease
MDRAELGDKVSNHTPTRTVRVSDELWNAAKEKAAEQGVTVTDVLITALEEFVES